MSPLLNNSVEKAFDVLMAFGAEARTMNLPEIAKAADISKSAAQRFAATLDHLGYLHKDEITKRYSLTPKLLELGLRYTHADPLIGFASPHLSNLNSRTRETVNLWRPDGVDVVCVSRFPSYKQVTAHMELGRRMPMYLSAAGRAYLSTLTPTTVEELLLQSSLVQYTPNTVISIKKLLALVAQARLDGYATGYDQYYRKDLAIGAPIRGPDGRGIGAINISVPTTRWTIEKALSTLSPQVMETASAISGVGETATAWAE